MKHFIIVLTDTCKIEETHYIINTSINMYSYRTEVYKNNVLLQVKENTFNSFDNVGTDDQNFINTYTNQHINIRNELCKKVDNVSHNVESNLEKNCSNFNDIQSRISDKEKYIKYSIYMLLIMGLFLLCFILFQTIFKYSDLYINMFYTNKQDKIIYLEKIEAHRHLLGDKCLALAKRKILEDSIITRNHCNMWCEKKTIEDEKCDLLLVYFNTNYSEIRKIQNLKVISKISTSLQYSISPKSDLIELNATGMFNLNIHNRCNHKINVRLKNIILNQSKNEEIVQFKEAKTSFVLQVHQEESFNIFLEPTYYKQFARGKYTGKLEFEISDDHNHTNFSKKIIFVVP